MLSIPNLDIKVCGITTSDSIITAAKNKIRSLGFASNNLLGPNTCDDDIIEKLINDFNSKNLNIDKNEVIRKIEECEIDAINQFQKENK